MYKAILENSWPDPVLQEHFGENALQNPQQYGILIDKCLGKITPSCNCETMVWPSQVSQKQLQNKVCMKSPVHSYVFPDNLNVCEKRHRTSRPKVGFTLVELLVVIAIIALLMSILMPTVARVQKQARTTACQSNLKQWGTIWAMYTDDNNSFFPKRTSTSGRWIDVLFDYYSREHKMRCCPMAKKIAFPDFPPGATDTLEVGGGPFTSWGKLGVSSGRPAGTWGSYGINGWVYVPGQDVLYGKPAASFWGTPNVKGAFNIPLFLDCWFWCGWPEHTNRPPQFDGQRWAGDEDVMQRYCINRHQQAINGVFLDYTVRKIWLKGLWNLKWSKRFDINAPKPDWATQAPWMAHFKDD